MKRKLVFVILLVILSLNLFADKHSDKLEQCKKYLDYLEENYKNHPEESNKIALKLLNIAKLHKFYKEECEAYTYLGMLAKNKAEFEKAEKFYNKAMQLAKKNDFKEYEATILNNIAILYTEKGDFEKAVKTYEKAFKIYEKFNNKKKIIDIYYNLSIIYRQRGKYDKALDYALKSLKYDEEQNDNKDDLATSCDNIAIIYYYLKNPQKSIYYFEKALKLRKEVNNKRGIAYSYNNLAVVYKSQKKYEKALEYLFNSLKIKEELKDKVGIASTLNNIGNFYRDRNQFAKAEKYYLKALKIRKDIGNRKKIVTSLIDLSKFYAMQKRYKPFEKYLKQAEDIAKKDNMRLQLSYIYQTYAQGYSELKDINKAFSYINKYIALKDSLLEEENQKKIAELQVQYETEKKEKQIQLLKKSREKELLIRNFLIVLSFIAIVFVVVLFKLFQSKKREIIYKNRIEQHILETNRTLEKRVQEELNKREKQQALLIQKSKLESLGRLSAGIAHEINQPVTHLSLGLDNIITRTSMNKLDEKYLIKKIDDLFKDITRIKNIIEHIRTFSRDQSSSKFEKIEVNNVFSDTIKLIKEQYKNHRIKLKLNLFEKPLYVLGNKFKLEQVFLNMLSNAKDSVEEKYQKNPSLEKEIKITTNIKNSKIVIEIEDNGIGISKENIEKIFDPFYTSKSVDKGTGLGLSISYGIIKEMEGEISVESEVMKFTKMIITLPAI